MKKVLLYVILFSACISVTAQTVKVTFRVNMAVQMKMNFNPASDYVSIAGNFQGWNSSSHHMTRLSETDSLWCYEYLGAHSGDTLEFKFLINGVTWENNDNRRVIVPPGGTTYTAYFNNDSVNKPIGNGYINFRVNMSVMREIGIFDPARDALSLMGEFNNWSDSDRNRSWMNQDPNDLSKYSLNLYFSNTILSSDVSYKYFVRLGQNDGLWVNGWESPIITGGGNRTIQFLGQNNQDAGELFFDGVSPDWVIPSGQNKTIKFSVNLAPAMDPSQIAVPFNPQNDKVFVIFDQAAFKRSQGWVDVDTLKVLRLSPNSNGSIVYSGTLTVKGPSFNAFLYRYAFVHVQNDGKEVWYFEPSGGSSFNDRVRFIRQSASRVFVQPYSAPVDTWSNTEIKTDQENSPFSNSAMLVLSSPNGGEILNAGKTKQITWNSAGVSDIKIELTTDNGINWTVISPGVPAADNGFLWAVPDVPSTSCKIRISDASNPSFYDLSSKFFTISRTLLTWSSAISIADGNNVTSKDVVLGCSPLATDGMDKAFDEQPLPPLPPQGAFDVRFKLPVTPADYSLKDYRSDTLKAVTWTMLFQPGAGGYPMTFSWDQQALPEGSFLLKDVINGSIVNVNMKTQSSFTLADENINSLKIEYKKQITSDVNLTSGWNIISVPVNAPDMNTQVLFPNFTSPTYGYSNGYQTVTTLENGKGYWIRNSQTQVKSISGLPVTSTAIGVKAGWNLIGIFDKNVLVNSITSTPQSIINSPFFSFSNGYQSSEALLPGKGYWIRVSQNGVINIPVLSKSAGVDQISSNKISKDWGKITLTDIEGNTRTLYGAKGAADLMNFDLPPVPPQGIFDVRYSTDRFVERADRSSSLEIMISSANYPLRLKVEGMDLKVKDRVNGTIVNKLLRSGEEIVILNKEIVKLLVDMLEVPVSYSLYQNYPNPFNPSTKITYSLAKDSHVTLKVYNALGEVVRELINSQQTQGLNEVTFNAGNLSSGIYFYEIEAKAFDGSKTFREVKKLMLMK